MPLSFNAVELCVVTIKEKPWTRAREVYGALEYGKTTKAADIVKHLCSRENYVHKWQLTEFVSEMNFMDSPKNSRTDDYYINEEAMYELIFGSQQSNTKNVRKHCCNVVFPQIWQQLANKMKEGHRQAIEEKDVALSLLNDDLKSREHENMALQAQRDVYQGELQIIQDTIALQDTILKHVMFLMRKIQAKTTLSSLYGNIQHLSMTSFMTCHIII